MEDRGPPDVSTQQQHVPHHDSIQWSCTTIPVENEAYYIHHTTTISNPLSTIAPPVQIIKTPHIKRNYSKSTLYTSYFSLKIIPPPNPVDTPIDNHHMSTPSSDSVWTPHSSRLILKSLSHNPAENLTSPSPVLASDTPFQSLYLCTSTPKDSHSSNNDVNSPPTSTPTYLTALVKNTLRNKISNQPSYCYYFLLFTGDHIKTYRPQSKTSQTSRIHHLSCITNRIIIISSKLLYSNGQPCSIYNSSY